MSYRNLCATCHERETKRFGATCLDCHFRGAGGCLALVLTALFVIYATYTIAEYIYWHAG